MSQKETDGGHGSDFATEKIQIDQAADLEVEDPTLEQTEGDEDLGEEGTVTEPTPPPAEEPEEEAVPAEEPEADDSEATEPTESDDDATAEG